MDEYSVKERSLTLAMELLSPSSLCGDKPEVKVLIKLAKEIEKYFYTLPNSK